MNLLHVCLGYIARGDLNVAADTFLEVSISEAALSPWTTLSWWCILLKTILLKKGTPLFVNTQWNVWSWSFVNNSKKGGTLEVVEGLRSEKCVCRLYDLSLSLSLCGFVYPCWVKDISKMQLLSVGWHHASRFFVFPQISSPQQASGHVNPDIVFSRACQGNFAMFSCLLSVFKYLHTWMIILFRWKMTLNSLEDIPFSAAIHTCWRKGRLNHYPAKNSIMNPPPLLRKVWIIVFVYGRTCDQSFDAPEMKRLKLKAGAWVVVSQWECQSQIIFFDFLSRKCTLIDLHF